jgi:hypothetical protein
MRQKQSDMAPVRPSQSTKVMAAGTFREDHIELCQLDIEVAIPIDPICRNVAASMDQLTRRHQHVIQIYRMLRRNLHVARLLDGGGRALADQDRRFSTANAPQ